MPLIRITKDTRFRRDLISSKQLKARETKKSSFLPLIQSFSKRSFFEEGTGSKEKKRRAAWSASQEKEADLSSASSKYPMETPSYSMETPETTQECFFRAKQSKKARRFSFLGQNMPKSLFWTRASPTKKFPIMDQSKWSQLPSTRKKAASKREQSPRGRLDAKAKLVNRL